MKKLYLLFATLLVVSCTGNSRVDVLMKSMTLDEKIGQLNQLASSEITGPVLNSEIETKIRNGQVGSILNEQCASRVRKLQEIAVNESRLGIPVIFGLDVIHGFRTTFPIPLAMSCSWDMEGIEEASRIAAAEASASGVAWTFAPMCDIARDARWGRIAEGAGEDPYLGAAVSAAQVRGFQGDLSKNTNIAACVKHFALYGAAEGGRDYNTVDMSRQQMLNDYVYPYKGAIDAGALTVMSSFNEYESIPMTLHKFMLTDLLRDGWGFKGMLVTDYTAIKECIAHGAIENLKEGAWKALDAGVDMDMVDEAFTSYLKDCVKEGLVSEKNVDRACRRVLELKEKLGLFDDPYKYCREEEEQQLKNSSANREAARRIAAESIVLLKNENNVLPVSDGKKIAVIGPEGDLSWEMLGCWSTASAFDAPAPVSLLDGLKARFGTANISFAPGCLLYDDLDVLRSTTLSQEGLNIDADKRAMHDEAIRVARSADVIVAAMGESARMSGEGCSRSDISLPSSQRALLKELVTLGKPVVLVTMAGRPLVLDWEAENVDAIVNAWHLGSAAGCAIADVLSGDVNPSGRLTASFPRNVGQIPFHYNHKNSGRPLAEGSHYQGFTSCYCDVPNDALYPFGFGLSYSKISYSDMKISADSLAVSSLPLKVSVNVTNESDRDAFEVVQLYVRDKVASSTRPVKELKGFKRVLVPAGKTETVELELTYDDLAFFNHDCEFVAEPGVFAIMTGPSSASKDLTSIDFKLLK